MSCAETSASTPEPGEPSSNRKARPGRTRRSAPPQPRLLEVGIQGAQRFGGAGILRLELADLLAQPRISALRVSCWPATRRGLAISGERSSSSTDARPWAAIWAAMRKPRTSSANREGDLDARSARSARRRRSHDVVVAGVWDQAVSPHRAAFGIARVGRRAACRDSGACTDRRVGAFGRRGRVGLSWERRVAFRNPVARMTPEADRLDSTPGQPRTIDRHRNATRRMTAIVTGPRHHRRLVCQSGTTSAPEDLRRPGLAVGTGAAAQSGGIGSGWRGCGPKGTGSEMPRSPSQPARIQRRRRPAPR